MSSNPAPDSITDQAIAAVGADDAPADWLLRPGEHADRLPASAGALARILRRAKIQEQIDEFTRHDTAAVIGQRRYKFWSQCAIWTRLGAIAIGALFLFPTFAAATKTDLFYQIAIGVQYACLAAAFLTTSATTYRKLFWNWMRARARAEIVRLHLFEFVAEANEETRRGEIPLLPLQLEYFKRHQLDVQTRYYKGRGEQHADAAGSTVFALRLFNALSVCAAVPVVLVVMHQMGFSLPFDDMLGKGLLVFGVIASAAFGALQSISLMNLDERNAERYSLAYENLDFMRNAPLAAARDAATRGDKTAVLEFIRAAHSLSSAEHREWVTLKECIQRPEQTAQFILQPTQISAPKG